MTKSANEVMQAIVYSAVVDAIDALKAGSGGLPNNLIRDLNAIHANTAFADLPKGLQDAIGQSVRSAFTRMLAEGYSVVPKGSEPPRPRPPAIPDRTRGPRPPQRRPGGGGGPDDRRPPRPRGPRPTKPRG